MLWYPNFRSEFIVLQLNWPEIICEKRQMRCEESSRIKGLFYGLSMKAKSDKWGTILLLTCLFQWEINYEMKTLLVDVSVFNPDGLIHSSHLWGSKISARRGRSVWSDLKMICPVITASLPCSSTAFICRISVRVPPVCISTDGLFVHLEQSDPTEYKRTHQKTLWGCFSSLKSTFSSHPSWVEVQITECERRRAFSCSTLSILETDHCFNTEGTVYLEPATWGRTHFSVRLCVCVLGKS